jgi:hypothetical protein
VHEYALSVKRTNTQIQIYSRHIFLPVTLTINGLLCQITMIG